MSNFNLFLELGFRHILEGYDHLLFLLGLVIVTKNWRELLAVITAFTIAHSTTLALSALEIFAMKPAFTESLIAVSIAYVGIENVVMKEHKYRWIVAGSFGLVHGAGFSGHLTGLLKTMFNGGLIVLPLLGFNLGIEIGQIIAIAAVAPILWILNKLGKKEQVVPEVSRMIAAVGLVLVVWRVWGL